MERIKIPEPLLKGVTCFMGGDAYHSKLLSRNSMKRFPKEIKKKYNELFDYRKQTAAKAFDSLYDYLCSHENIQRDFFVKLYQSDISYLLCVQHYENSFMNNHHIENIINKNLINNIERDAEKTLLKILRNTTEKVYLDAEKSILFLLFDKKESLDPQD